VVAVVLDHGELAAAVGGRHLHVAIALEAAADAAELGQRLCTASSGMFSSTAIAMADSAFSTLCMAGQVQLHVQVGQRDAVAALHVKCICGPTARTSTARTCASSLTP
jgi:hypothetical protein